MPKKSEALPNFWSIYHAINFENRFSKNREFTDKTTGKKYTYSYIGEDKLRDNIFLGVFSGIMWLSFPFLIVLLSAIYFLVNPFSFLLGAFAIIGYHYAAMYYVIRGPHMEIKEVKKKGIIKKMMEK